MNSREVGSLRARLPVARAMWGAGVLLVCVVGEVWSGTTGKIAGHVTDAKKVPLAGVNIAIPALHVGAATDAEGRFTILQVPSGSWDLRVNLLGYRALTLQGVQVSADNTTPLEVELAEAPIAMSELVVSAKRPVVDLKLTSSLASIHREEIAKLPVQDLQEIVNLQAGVVAGHFLGGRLGEVQYQVDGVSVNNPYDNSNSLKIDRSLIEEVQVVTGTFDAEYGQAMSGVVNAVLRRGTEKFQWNAEAFLGAYSFSQSARYGPIPVNSLYSEIPGMVAYHFPPGIHNLQASASGPTRFDKTTYLVDVRQYNAREPYDATRTYAPWYAVPTQAKVQNPDGDGKELPLGWSHELSGLAKLTNRSIPHLELSYQAIANRVDRQAADFAYVLDPDGRATDHTRSVVHGIDVTRTLSNSAFLNAALRQNYFDTRHMKYDNLYDSRYDRAGPPTVAPNSNDGLCVEGVDFARSTQNTNGAVLKTSYTNQIRRDQQIKLGLEYQWPHVKFGSPGALKYVQSPSGGNILQRHVNEPPSYPGVQEFRPFITAAYAQDELEWNDLHVRAGARFEYFNPRSTLPSDLANPANSIPGVPTSVPQATTRKVSLAPRLGVSYPVTPRSAIYFSYGHFYQMPALGLIYGNSNYSILSGLQAGGIDYGVLGNPDIRPERTVQYQFGYKQSITDDFGIDANMFFKDIRDLLGVEFIDTYNGATYSRLTNVDFGNVIGVTLSINRRNPWVTTGLEYTWQVAEGAASDPQETATRAKAGEDPRPRTVPFNWDQRHTLNLTVTLGRADLYSVSGILRVASGQPYTPATVTTFSTGLETNSGRKPASANLDLRGERFVRMGDLPVSLFARVFNAFDQRFNNGLVFATSGSPYYSRFPSKDEPQLINPTRFYAPRRIELGISLHSVEGH